MYNLLSSLKDYFKIRDITTDFLIFRLHYQFTVALLVAFSIIITATQYVGNPIDCITDDIPTHVINTYCWIMSTFTLPDAFYRQVGEEVAALGVGNPGDFKAQKYYSYYQWVVFVLFLMAILCYTPKALWDAWEGDVMQTVVMGLNWGLKSEDEVSSKKKTLIDYMLRHIKQHNMYAYRYWLCELLCLVNIVGQMYLMNTFFDNEFFTYGLRIVNFSEMPQEERVDPMVYVFPRLTKCTFHKIGPSGTVTKHDTLCVLALNIVNEKTFVFVWFWYVIMATLLAFLVVVRLIMIFAPVIRPKVIYWNNRMVPEEALNVICRKTSIGDWWILYLLSYNLDPFVYRDIIGELSKKIETAASNAPGSYSSTV